ncbi:MAG: two-component system NarL family sensor kinase [Cyclobacteriaceae bacterium]|jgi:two-component system NarL family sensor kinase
MQVRLIAYYLIIGFFGFFHLSSRAQDQRVADSLRHIYLRDDLADTTKLELLKKLSFNEVNDFNLALSYIEEMIEYARNHKNKYYMSLGYFQKGNNLRVVGDLDDALDAYLKSMTIAKDSGYKSMEGSAYCAIADIYSFSNNYTNAMLYYHKAIAILRQNSDSIALASTILNAGDEYLTHQEYDSALLYFTESGKIFEKVNYLIGTAYNLGNIGMVYANIGESNLAEININEAIRILETAEDFYPVCFYLLSMSDIYLEKGDNIIALNYASRSLDLAQKYNLKQQISDANLKLSTLYEKRGNLGESLIYYKNYIAYRDSVNNIEIIHKIADQRTEFEVNLKEKEIDLLEKSRTLDRTYILIAIILLILSIVLLLYFRQRFRNAQLKATNERKQQGEKIKSLLTIQETKALESMVQGRDHERKRLAQELHNHFGSLLATIKVNINGIAEEAIPNHHTLTTLVDQACSDVRNMSHALNMGISEDFGLVPALKELTSHLRQSGELAVEFGASMGNRAMESDEEITIYRIVQELVSNVLKHAQATKLSILLTCFEEENLINIMVQDNGIGFQESPKRTNSNGMGIKSLHQMVNSLNGEMKLDSSAKSGTTVNIDLPLKPNTSDL